MSFRSTFRLLGLTLSLLAIWVIRVTPASAFVPDRAYYEKHGDIVWEVPTNEKWIALTFDDGPNETYTPEVLDVLKKYHAKATFFVIGEHVIEHPDLVKREVKEGHEIENHTFTHRLLQRIGKKAFMEDVHKADEVIQKFQPSSVKLFRPPGGVLNLNKPTIKELRKEHFEIVSWTWHQDTEDWKRPGTERIIRQVIKNAHSGDIVIMHDSGGNRSQTVNALKSILPELEAKGYQFVTVADLLRSCPKYRFLFKDEPPLHPDLPQS